MNIHIVALYVINILIIILILYYYNKLKEIVDIKNNFNKTNRKIQEVNKAVNSLNAKLKSK